MCNKKRHWQVPILIFLVFCSTAVLFGQEEQADPVLDFYCSRAKAVYPTLNPSDNGAAISFVARSYLTELKRGGREILTDSSIVQYYFSFGQLDSQQVIISTTDELLEIDFSYPNLFDRDYDFYFYPNDAGGDAIAIGVDSYTTSGLSPVGMAVIDRTHYYLLRLYLYFPGPDKYERYSKEMSFINHEGVVFPDTMRVTFARAGVFSTEHYRRETIVDSLVVTP
ncbi:MAG: hypothetical protein KOO62_09960 [candidate division Zixibacteria bacterium]|nr:hypothetical protein [candidate division Zixibacteria bacterium]